MIHVPEQSSSKPERLAATFLRNLILGKICVHPTDTIPGLTCNPVDVEAVRRLEEIKKRREKKAMVGLVASFEQAEHFWAPLPDFWRKTIASIWPAPISFVWKSRPKMPPCLLSERGELALRCPQLREGDMWLSYVLKRLKSPLPSTSVNYTDEAAITSGEELSRFCIENDIYLPSLSASEGDEHKPSSLVRIIDNSTVEWLREGAFSREQFEAACVRNREEVGDA